ncbi:DUF4173 domain-containing protein [Rhizobium sp. P38BS-XIX]|uniref:DUF4153 domain-containing protein n=1 Tax=Rhizobium sp. P38BS-XIX TaxID=2726740 RepID=UPI00145666D7|nr:DUF4173 domain-containing protein [Rhizobium sp. P38BS-XIX]NLR98403.1 DUF4173 domain-containing protein [Rhizobium sp. P38BS-XIX]
MSISDLPIIPLSPASNSNRKSLTVIALVILADFLLFDRELGLNLFLMVNASAIGILVCARRSRSLWSTATLLLLCTLLSLPLLETPSWMGVSVSMLGLISVSLGGSGLLPRRWQRLPVIVLRFLLDLPLRPFRKTTYSRFRHSRRATPQAIWSYLRGWIMPLGFAAGFVALFANANPLIEKALRSVDFYYLLQFLDIWRIGFWLVIALGLFILLHPRLKRLPSRGHQAIIDRSRRPSEFFGHTALLRSLVLFNALFTIQTLLDLTYLWGGASLPDGMSHAEYAHRGAYPLMATALLAAVFVLAAMRRGGPGDHSRLIRALVHLWIAQNILLCVSSILRLDLYVESYSLTELRVAAGIWMGLVAVGLFLILLRILLHRSNEWLVALSMAALVATLYGTALADIPAFIARFNVAHSQEISGDGVPLDIEYLSTLGPSVLPALDAYLANLPTGWTEKAAVATNLRNAFVWSNPHNPDDWRSWTFRTVRLDHYLRDHPTLAR